MSAALLLPHAGETIVFNRVQLPLKLPKKRSKHVAAVQKAYDILEPAGNYCVPSGSSTPLPLALEWKLGVVYGASGGGKSSTLRLFVPDEKKWFGDGQSPFDPKRPVVEQVHEDPEEAQKLLQDVGLKSVPAWLAPFGSMSTGQKARADLTRVLKALEEERGATLAVDEFGSLLDPTTREAMAYSFSKAVAKRAPKGSHVVVAVNDERLLQWLQPCWIFDVDACEYRFAKRFLDQEGVREQLAKHFKLKDRGKRLQGGVPERSIPLTLKVRLVGVEEKRRVWDAFKHHHYLDHKATGHLCFVLLLQSPFLNCGKEVLAGLLLLNCYAQRNEALKTYRAAARFVVAPSVQGLGIGPRALAMIGSSLASAGLELRFVTSHLALVKSFERSGLWESTGPPKSGAESILHGGTRAGSHAKRLDRIRYFFKFNVKEASEDAPKLDPALVPCSFGGRGLKNPCDLKPTKPCYEYSKDFSLKPPWDV